MEETGTDEEQRHGALAARPVRCGVPLPAQLGEPSIATSCFSPFGPAGFERTPTNGTEAGTWSSSARSHRRDGGSSCAASRAARRSGQRLEARRADARAIGYDSLWLYDHFHTVPRTEIQPTFECWTTMAALAEATTTIRLGQLVTCSLYRNPGYLAKISACVDVISGGRVDVGPRRRLEAGRVRRLRLPLPEDPRAPRPHGRHRAHPEGDVDRGEGDRQRANTSR